MTIKLLAVTLATALALAGASAEQQQQRRSLRGSPDLKRVPLAAETEQFEATHGDESELITAKLAAAHAQKHVIPSLSWTPIVPVDEVGPTDA